jgi:hypothetical protein
MAPYRLVNSLVPFWRSFYLSEIVLGGRGVQLGDFENKKCTQLM